VTLADKQKLERIAKRQKPPLTKQYLVNWAVQKLLLRSQDKKLDRELVNLFDDNKNEQS
jgi:hypothetical protein